MKRESLFCIKSNQPSQPFPIKVRWVDEIDNTFYKGYEVYEGNYTIVMELHGFTGYRCIDTKSYLSKENPLGEDICEITFYDEVKDLSIYKLMFELTDFFRWVSLVSSRIDGNNVYLRRKGDIERTISRDITD